LFGAPIIDRDRAVLKVAAVVGVALGIVTDYALGKPLFGILIWGLIGAVIVSGMVYCLRAFRS
jgi:hypothetical protein